MPTKNERTVVSIICSTHTKVQVKPQLNPSSGGETPAKLWSAQYSLETSTRRCARTSTFNREVKVFLFLMPQWSFPSWQDSRTHTEYISRISCSHLDYLGAETRIKVPSQHSWSGLFVCFVNQCFTMVSALQILFEWTFLFVHSCCLWLNNNCV